MKSTYYSLGLIALLTACTPDTQLLEDITTPKAEVLDTKLPIARVTTLEGQNIPDEPKIEAELLLQQQGQTLFTGRIGIEIRGQSSQMFPKKQYGFETRNDQNEGIDVSLLGFPEEEDWIFHAPYSDKSLMRNALIYDLSRAIGRYTTRVQYIDFYLNGRYDGLYLLMEKLKRDKNRIDLNNLKEDENTGEDLTGGYILKIDKESEYTTQNMFESRFDPPLATGGQQIRFLYEDPDPDDITPAQREYISNYVHGFEAALASENFADPELGYAAYIDVDSFVDFFLLNELAQNVDGFRLSTWLVKDKNKKLAMGPIWDFNLAFGNANYCGGNATDVWTYQFNQRCSADFWLVPFWWNRLLEDPNFKAKVKERWQALRADAFAEQALMGRIDAYVTQLSETNNITNNFARWPVLGAYVWPNNFIGATYEQEIDYLKGFISQRLNWLDAQIGQF
jgi:spore coat protein CotH